MNASDEMFIKAGVTVINAKNPKQQFLKLQNTSFSCSLSVVGTVVPEESLLKEWFPFL